MSALRSAIDRSVSTEWREFLQGMISIINSGGDLRTYFNAKALESMQRSRGRLRAAISGMGVMAEAYVTVGVAFPIFLIILLIAMSIMSSSMDTSLLIGMVVFILIPLIELTFGWILYSMAKEASG
jgi:Bacterial type II secretion system protein F domain.